MAVRSNDVSMLTQVPGVGKKTAERLLLELKSRLDMLGDIGGVPATVVSVGDAQFGAGGATPTSAVREAEDALIALGYRPQEASRAVVLAVGDDPAGAELLGAEELVRRALRGFARSSDVS